MITDKSIPSDIFGNINKLWNTVVKYNITTYPNPDLKHPPLYFLEDTFVRTRSFSDYMNPPEEDYNIENISEFKTGSEFKTVLTFKFYGHEDYLNEWDCDPSEENALEYEELNEYCYVSDSHECECNAFESCDGCLLYWFKKNISYELYNRYYMYKHLTTKINSLNSNTQNFKDIYEDNFKCIARCGSYTNKYVRDLDKLNTLYCNMCLPTYLYISADEHYNKLKQHFTNIARIYEIEFNNIMDFLKNPLPQIIDFDEDGKFELVSD